MNLNRLIGLRSTTARFAALALLVLALSSTAVLLIASHLATRALDTELVEMTRAQARAIDAAYRRGGPAAAAALVRLELAQSPQQVMLFEGPGGRRLAGNAQGWPPTLEANVYWHEIRLYTRTAAEPDLFGVTTLRLDPAHRLMVGYSLAERTRLLRSLGDALLGAFAVALLLATSGAWALSRFIGNRVREMADAASAVAAGDLSQRVRMSGDHDPFDDLAAALNAMLLRIEGLVGEMRIVTDSLAHDLRSPLTRMKARIERAVADPDANAARTALEGIAIEADALLHLVTLALEVSRAEAGIGREAQTRVDVAAIVRDIAEMYGPLAEDAGVALSVSVPEELPLCVHRQFLSQALANLVDNVLKYAGARSLRLSASAEQRGVRIEVVDDGRGIAPENRARALARFSRLDSARSTPGSGLGLSLAAAVAHMHGGTLCLEDAKPGLRVVLDLPSQAHGAKP